MSRKYVGGQKTSELRVKRPNGDIYVYERIYHYDPVKRYEVTDSKRLKGKIRKGTDVMVPTRPKRKSSEQSWTYRDEQKAPVTDDSAASSEDKSASGGQEDNTSGEDNTVSASGVTAAAPDTTMTASRKRVGMIDLIQQIADRSGVSYELLHATKGDTGLALKAETLAWYCFATDGDTWPGIENWSRKYLEQLPYNYGPISQDMYHDVFVRLGADESIRQSIFKHRADTIGHSGLLALDSTTIATESKNLVTARTSMHKDTLIKPVYKHITFYKLEERQPVAFELCAGNMPDVSTVDAALRQLKVLGMKDIEIISDGGYASDPDLCDMLRSPYHFVTRVSADRSWVSPIIDECRDEIQTTINRVECDPSYGYYSKTIMHEFTYTRLKGRNETGAQKGDPVTIRRRLHVFVFYNATRRGEEEQKFFVQFEDIKKQLNQGIELLPEDAKFAKKYMIISKRGDKITSIDLNKKATEAKMKYSGFLTLVADKEKNASRGFLKYRKREYIEEDIKNYKGHSGGDHPRVWDDDTLYGQMTVQFMALSMHEEFESMVRDAKENLGVSNGDPEHDKNENLNAEKQARNWLRKRSLKNLLKWFDGVYELSVKNGKKGTDWVMFLSSRDKLILNAMGLKYDH